MPGRRRFLQSLAALAAAQARPLRAQAPGRLAESPFGLGVASGYPGPDGMVLWTRLLGVPDSASVPVRWEIAHDERFSSMAGKGELEATAEWAHSVRAEPRGLEPGRWYFYRFIAGGQASPVGRTRTSPAAGSAAPRLRFAFASCQQYEQGWYGAHRHLAGEDLDLVAFLGDYIYESSWGRDHVRKHGAGVPTTLDEYRARYALYKSDPDLQRSHRAFPWIFTWDDHEVVNDYAGASPGDQPPSRTFLARRAAAYRAFYEHLPLPEAMRPGDDGAMRIYTHLDWGRVARFHVLDDRQYRDAQACRAPGSRGAPIVSPQSCPELNDAARTLLGAEQERWLDGTLAASRARWNVIVQQTLMAQLDRKLGPERQFWTDGWDGYPAARRRLLETIRRTRVRNAVVIGGDVHSSWVADLKPDFDDASSPVVASELCGTSITSQGPSQRMVEALMGENPHIKFGRGDRRGYVRASVAGGRLDADFVVMDSVKIRDPKSEVLASFAVEDGKPGPQRA